MVSHSNVSPAPLVTRMEGNVDSTSMSSSSSDGSDLSLGIRAVPFNSPPRIARNAEANGYHQIELQDTTNDEDTGEEEVDAQEEAVNEYLS